MDIRPKVTHQGKTEIFASPQDGHLYDENGKMLEEFTDSNGFKRVFIDGKHYNVSLLCGKAFGLPMHDEEDEIIIGHKDGNRANNRKDNLFWYGENTKPKDYKKPRIRRTNEKQKERPFKQINPKTGETINIWKSLNHLSCNLEYPTTPIYMALASGITYKGYKWEYLTEEETKKLKSENNKNKQPQRVVQIDPDTDEVIQIYESINQAAKRTKSNFSTLYNVLIGKKKMTNGYKWRYFIEGDVIKDATVREKKKRGRKPTLRKILQIDLKTGETIKVWNGTLEAQRAVGRPLQNHISRCCRGIISKAYDYKWQFQDEPHAYVYKYKFKAVSQYTTDGQFIKTYKSVTEASKALGILQNSISQCLNGKSRTAGKFVWKYADEVKNQEPIMQEPIIEDCIKKGEPTNIIKAVNQYTKDGEFIETYKTVAEASRATGICEGSIRHCVKDRRKTAGGFVWKYDNEVKESEPTKENEIIPETFTNTPQETEIITDEVQNQEPIKKKRTNVGRPVIQLDRFTCKKIAEFKSLKEASKKLNCSYKTIWDTLKGRYPNAGGFKWVYAEDYVEPSEEIKEDLTLEDIKDAPTEDLCKDVRTAPCKPDTADRKDYRMLEVEKKTKRKTLMLDPDTRRVLCEFKAISYAARLFNIYPQQVVEAVKHNRKLCGYLWEFK